jgi:hypothetical protein
MFEVHPDFTRGMTAQPSRSAIAKSAGIHICAWESPTMTIAFELVGSPSRQMLLVVAASFAGTQPGGN